MNRQLARRVEKALYEYPVWKVNLLYLQPRFGVGLFAARRAVGQHGDPVETLGLLRLDYASRIALVEATLARLTPLEADFVRRRYFAKKPFKVIANELAVTERHLYRIRNQIIQHFGVAFGWE